MTPLDQALQAAIEDAQLANDFFDAFLNSPIFIPVMREGAQTGTWTALRPDDRFVPLLMKQGEERAVPVFDTLDKMQEWAGERGFDYLVLTAHVFLKVIAPEVGILLNEGTSLHYRFSPRILEQLRAAMKPMAPAAHS